MEQYESSLLSAESVENPFEDVHVRSPNFSSQNKIQTLPPLDRNDEAVTSGNDYKGKSNLMSAENDTFLDTQSQSSFDFDEEEGLQLKDKSLVELKDDFHKILGTDKSSGLWMPLQRHSFADRRGSVPSSHPLDSGARSDDVSSMEHDNSDDDDDSAFDGTGGKDHNAIKLRHLPISTTTNDPQIQLLSPNRSTFGNNDAYSRGSSLEVGDGNRLSVAPLDPKATLSSALQRFSSRIVRGNDSDVALKRLSRINSSEISILNDPEGDGNIYKTASLNLSSPSLNNTASSPNKKTKKQEVPEISFYDADADTNLNANLEADTKVNPYTNGDHYDHYNTSELNPVSIMRSNLASVSRRQEVLSEEDREHDASQRYDSSPGMLDVKTDPAPIGSMKHFSRTSPNHNKNLGLYGKSLGYFGPYNLVRVTLAHGLASIPDVFLLSMYIFHTVLLAYQQWNPPLTYGYVYHPKFSWVDWIILVVNVLFTLEIVAKIVSFGLYDDSGFFEEYKLPRRKSIVDTWVAKVKFLLYKRSKVDQIEEDEFKLKHSFTIKPQFHVSQHDLENMKEPFFRNNWNVIDFVSCASYWISLLMKINRTDLKIQLPLFRALASIRIFRLARLTQGTFTIIKSLEHALPQLANIGVFVLYFWILFSIAGVQTFKSSFTRQCVYTNPSNDQETFLNSNDYQFCGGWLDPDTGKPMAYLNDKNQTSHVTKGYWCPRYSQCMTVENPYKGTVNFDNIFQSMELIYVIISMNTFSDLMYYTMDAENMAAAIFFIVAIFVLTIWLVNIFMAAIVTSFKTTNSTTGTEENDQTQLTFFEKQSQKKMYISISLRKRIDTYLRYEFVWVTIIIVDIVAQAMKRADSSESSLNIIYVISIVTTYLLLFEIIVRFLIYMPHWRQFFYFKRNTFDLFVAIVTAVVVLPPLKSSMGSVFNWLTIFQIVRFYRCVHIVKFTRELWLDVVGNFKAIGNLTFFFFLTLILFSVVASTYFEGFISHSDMEENGILLAMNTLPNTFLALYVITSTENWTSILYALQESAKSTVARVFGAVIIIGWFVFSNTIVLNIFVAVIAENLEINDTEKKKEQVKAFIRDTSQAISKQYEENYIKKVLKKFKVHGNTNKKDYNTKKDLTEIFRLLMAGTVVENYLEKEDFKRQRVESKEMKNQFKDQHIVSKNPVASFFTKQYHKLKAVYNQNPFFKRREEEIENSIPADKLYKNLIMEDKIIAASQKAFLDQHPSFNSSLFIFTPKNRLRAFCQLWVKPSVGDRFNGRAPDKKLSEVFNVIMLLGTIAVVAVACYTTPLYSYKQDANEIWTWMLFFDLALTLLFTIEFLIKVIADGFFYTPNGMLRSSWNVIDVLVLITLWLNLIFSFVGNGNASRVIRGFKALRALRLLTISETAKKTFHRIIIAGFGKILGAAAVSFCLLFPFSIWGLNIFRGRLGVCNDSSATKEMCYGEFQNQVFDWDVVFPRTYGNPYLHFDSFSHSFSTLFQISSLEGWVDLLEYVTQSSGVGTVTGLFKQPYNAIFLVFYMFLANIFILNLFVSVIISNYSKTTGSAFLTTEHISWKEVEKLLSQVTPSRLPRKETLTGVKRLLYDMTLDRKSRWNILYRAMLFFHLILLLSESSKTPNGGEMVRSALFLIFSLYFFVHASFKQYAKGFRLFFESKWDLFQFFVSGTSTVLMICYMALPENTKAISILCKSFLLLITILIIPTSNRLSLLLKFASASLPSILSLLYTWFILFMVYAIALNQIFGLTKIGASGNGNLNVRTVTKALIMLFKMSFGEGWNSLMYDYYVDEPYCTQDDGFSDCGNHVYALVLFVSWNVISMFIFLNLFISLVVENFSYIYHRSGPCSLITRDEIRKFKEVWANFDPNGTGYIAVKDLYKFLHSLNGVLSFKLYDGRLSIKNLKEQWFPKELNKNKSSPYDYELDTRAMEATLKSIDVDKVRHRKLQFERFVEEALHHKKVNHLPGISFNQLLLQIPLYTQFQQETCLGLGEYLERYILMKRLDEIIAKKKRAYARKTFITRWRFIRYMESEKKRHQNQNVDSFLGSSIYSP